MHRVLVSLVREWVRDLGPDDLLFPRIERKKTWLMVKKDLERIGIPYETADGIADFHAAGRHSHITGLVRSGATIMEAKELARHADIRQTVKYTHIGMEDRAEALAGLPSPFTSADVDCLHYVCNSGGVLSQKVTPAVTDIGVGRKPKSEQAPVLPGLASSLVTNRHQLTVCGKVEAAGIAPASREASTTASTCVADHLIVGLRAPIGRVPFGLASHEFNPSCNRRLSSSDPELASPAASLGRKRGARPLLFFRQRDGVSQHCCWHLKFWSAFYEAR